MPIVWAGGGTGLGGPVDPRYPVKGAFIREPSRAGCGCLVLMPLLIGALLVIAGQL